MDYDDDEDDEDEDEEDRALSARLRQVYDEAAAQVRFRAPMYAPI